MRALPPAPRPVLLRAPLAGALVLALALALAPPTARAEDPSGSVAGSGLVVEPGTFDFGDVGQEEEHEAQFVLHNKGQTPIEGLRASADCGCYAVTLSTTSLAPGAKGTLTVAFRTLRFTGPFMKRARLNWKEGAVLHGMPLGLKLAVRKGVVLDSRAWFGEVLVGETPEPVTVLARYHETAGAKFAITRITPPEGLQVLGRPSPWQDPADAAFKGYAIRLGFTKPPPRGSFGGHVVIETDHPRHARLTLPVQASVVGKVALQVSRLSLGLVPQGRGRTVRTRIRATRPKDFPLGTVAAKAQKGRLTVRVEAAAGQPGAYDIVVEVPASAAAGRLDDAIEIQTGIPEEPTVTLPVTGRVFQPR